MYYKSLILYYTLSYNVSHQLRDKPKAKYETDNMARADLVINVSVKNQAVHFCETKLAGEDHNLWFPLPLVEGADLFSMVEDIMVLNGIANNITEVKELRQCGDHIDFQVIYNEK